MLANLVCNSAAAGATTVRVHVWRDGGFATLEVVDDGPGISQGLPNAAFERSFAATAPAPRGVR